MEKIIKQRFSTIGGEHIYLMDRCKVSKGKVVIQSLRTGYTATINISDIGKITYTYPGEKAIFGGKLCD